MPLHTIPHQSLHSPPAWVAGNDHVRILGSVHAIDTQFSCPISFPHFSKFHCSSILYHHCISSLGALPEDLAIFSEVFFACTGGSRDQLSAPRLAYSNSFGVRCQGRRSGFYINFLCILWVFLHPPTSSETVQVKDVLAVRLILLLPSFSQLF